MKRMMVLFLLVLALVYVGYTQLTKEQHPDTVEIGQLTPQFELLSLTDATLSNQVIPKEGLVLNFWATYCPPCLKEMPLLQQAFEKENVQIWAVNVGESPYFINRFLVERPVTFPILIDQKQLASTAFEVMSLPTTYFIDGNGIVKKRIQGELTKDLLAQGLAMIQ